MGSFTSLNKNFENVQPKSTFIVPQLSIHRWHMQHQLGLFPQWDLEKKVRNSQNLQNDICKDDRCM